MIREIYRIIGALPGEIAGADSEKYVEAMEQAEALKTKLCDELPPELQEDFREFVEQQSIIAAEGREDGFVQGFRLAAKLIMDVCRAV